MASGSQAAPIAMGTGPRPRGRHAPNKVFVEAQLGPLSRPGGGAGAGAGGGAGAGAGAGRAGAGPSWGDPAGC